LGIESGFLEDYTPFLKRNFSQKRGLRKRNY